MNLAMRFCALFSAPAMVGIAKSMISDPDDWYATNVTDYLFRMFHKSEMSVFYFRKNDNIVVAGPGGAVVTEARFFERHLIKMAINQFIKESEWNLQITPI